LLGEEERINYTCSVAENLPLTSGVFFYWIPIGGWSILTPPQVGDFEVAIGADITFAKNGRFLKRPILTLKRGF